MSIKYNNLKLFVLMNKQKKLLQNSISEYIKQWNKQRALVIYKQKPYSIVVYKPIIRNTYRNFHSFPNIA
jgi:hypothetical protein